jgi:hypothetical protein
MVWKGRLRPGKRRKTPNWSRMTNDTLKPVPKLHLDPNLYADHSQRIGLHEAAHCVASYLFGRPIHSAEAHWRRGVTRLEETDDVFASAVVTLAGEAFERSIGLKFKGSRGPNSDLAKADALLKTVVSGPALDEAAKVIEEAAISLVETERFQKLAFILGPVITRERYVTASQIRRILEEADPERESHGLEAHSERTRQRFPWRDHHVPRDHDRDCVVCAANPERARAARAGSSV